MKNREATDDETAEPAGRPAAALALASGASHTKAAEKAGVHKNTITQWVRDPEFTAEISRLRAEMLDQAVGILAAHAADASTTLTGCLDAEKDADRIRAAKEILTSSVAVRQSADLAAQAAAAAVAEVTRQQGEQLAAILRTYLAATGLDPHAPDVAETIRASIAHVVDGAPAPGALPQ